MGIDKAQDEPTRRDFVTVAATAFVGVGAAAVVWPLVDQMNPNGGSPRRQVIPVDLSRIAPGQTLTVGWRNLPVMVRHRTHEEIEAVRAVALSALPDRLARNANLAEGATAEDHSRVDPEGRQWLVVVGVCTHLGCRLKPTLVEKDDAVGTAFFCPCHAARFDAAGRVRSGPARTNLPVPPYRLLGTSRIEIG